MKRLVYLGASLLVLLWSAHAMSGTALRIVRQQKLDDALCIAARYGKPEEVRALLHEGASVDASRLNSTGGRKSRPRRLTALEGAVYWERSENVRVLLQAGADPNLSFAGLYWAALPRARLNHDGRTEQLLIQYGACDLTQERSRSTAAGYLRNRSDQAPRR